MTVLGVDYSFSRPSPALLHSKGFKAVGRYLGGSRDKDITRAEAAALHAHGLGIWIVFEGGASRSAQGYAAGVADARAALAQANSVGLPAGCPIFFAVDFNGSWAQVAAYFAGTRKVLGSRTGPYGSYAITTAARSAGYRWTWQTCAWSGGRVDSRANIYQRQQMTRFVPGCDENEVLNAFPVWGAAVNATTPVAAQPVPNLAPIIGELNAVGRKAKTHAVWLRIHNAVLALTGKK